MKTIKDSFIEKIYNKYFVTENLARLLYERWQIERKCLSDGEIESFLNSALVQKVFLLTPEINIVQKYTLEQLNTIGAELTTVVDAEKRIFLDKKFNFTWQELFHGPSESYTGLYQIIKPQPDDSALNNSNTLFPL